MVPVSGPETERVEFQDFASQADATFVIAPEFDGMLRERHRQVEAAGGCWLGCSATAIELCADKLACARHLEQHGIGTPSTHEVGSAPHAELPWPRVLKPRDGAGATNTFLVQSTDEWNQRVRGDGLTSGIEQPFVEGTTLSVAVIVGGSDHCLVLPTGRQRVGQSAGEFEYLGGSIAEREAIHNDVADLARSVVKATPGLRGWVGLDVIQPSGNDSVLHVVDINPRLTTSYLGQRELFGPRLAEAVIESEWPWNLQRRGGTVWFDADGRVEQR